MLLAELARIKTGTAFSMHDFMGLNIAAKVVLAGGKGTMDLSPADKHALRLGRIRQEMRAVKALLDEARIADQKNWEWTGGGMNNYEWERKIKSYGSETHAAVEAHQHKLSLLQGEMLLAEIEFEFRNVTGLGLSEEYVILSKKYERAEKLLWEHFEEYNIEEHDYVVYLSRPGARMLWDFQKRLLRRITEIEQFLGFSPEDRSEEVSFTDEDEVADDFERFPKQERMHSDYKRKSDRSYKSTPWRDWKQYRRHQTKAMA